MDNRTNRTTHKDPNNTDDAEDPQTITWSGPPPKMNACPKWDGMKNGVTDQVTSEIPTRGDRNSDPG